jgi:sugar phosphate isomerase/epimerase
MKLATTTQDLCNYAPTIADGIRLFKDTGFKCLDFNFYQLNKPGSAFRGDSWMRAIEDAAIAAEDIGATFVQAHAPAGSFFSAGEEYEHFIRTTIRSIEACQFLGIKDIVVHPVFTVNTVPASRGEYLEFNRRFYENFFPVMDKTGVNVLVENGFEPNLKGPKVEKPGIGNDLFYFAEDMLEAIDYIGHPNIHACWDTGHAALRKMDQYNALTKLGSRLHAVHIQDNFGDNDQHIAPFMGVLNLDEIMHGLIDAGFKGAFTFEACYLIRQMNIRPVYRKKWEKDTRLANPPAELMRKAVAFMYEIGKSILSAYGVYEY